MKECEELIQAYIYDVIRRLPQNQKQGMETEIKGFIYDTIEEQGKNIDNIEEVKEVLMQLGNPRELANKYRDKKRYLIGPEYYDTYCWVLKIVLLATTVGILISNIILSLLGEGKQIVENLLVLISNLEMGLILAFAFVTILFAILETHAKKIETPKRQWKLEDLPSSVSEKKKIKRGEIIVGIVFSSLVIILFNLYPNLMGMNWIQNGELVSYPLFNLQTLTIVLPLFNLVFIIGMIRDMIKAIEGRYTKRLAIGITLLNIISIGLCIFIFTQPNLINYEILNGIEQHILKGEGDISSFATILHNFAKFFLGIIILAFSIESITAISKGFKNTKSK